MIDRHAREKALDELAIAVAEATVDAWLDGERADDGLDTHNNTGHDHETADKASAPSRRDKSAKTNRVRSVRRTDR